MTSQNWIFLFNMTHRNWTLLFNITQRIEHTFFEYDSKNLNFSAKKYDSKNWTLSRKKPQKEDSFSNMTQRIELFLFATWLKKLNFFSIRLWELNSFFQYDSKNWNPSCFPIWVNKLNHGSKYALALENWPALCWHADMQYIVYVQHCMRCDRALYCLVDVVLLGLCGEHVLAFSELIAERAVRAHECSGQC